MNCCLRAVYVASGTTTMEAYCGAAGAPARKRNYMLRRLQLRHLKAMQAEAKLPTLHHDGRTGAKRAAENAWQKPKAKPSLVKAYCGSADASS
jgi:hypothetical protein